MSRIRTIKPEFPQSETTGRLSRDARLLFIQIWTLVDDSGKTRAASRALASLLYPYDDDAPSLIGAWLAELVREDCIRLYEVNGSHYLEVINWLKHQKIDRPSKSRFPPPREPSRGLDANSRTLDADLGPSKKDAAEEAAPLPSFNEGPLSSPEKELFEKGKQVLGRASGGLIRNLLKAKAGNVALARAAVEQASTKHDPREYIGRIVRGASEETKRIGVQV